MKSKATNLVELLADCPDHLCDLVLELRDLVRAVAPETTETIRWNALNYHKAHEGGLVKGAVCQIVPRDDCLHLAFIHGAFLPDPTGLLDGDRKAKRYVRILTSDDVHNPAIQSLIRAAVRYKPS
jgi:hypothetical protein